MPLESLSLLKKGQILPELGDELPSLRILSERTEVLLSFLRSIGTGLHAYAEVEAALGDFKRVTDAIDCEFHGNQKMLRSIREGFRRTSSDVFLKSRLFRSVRTWQEGYPADYLTMEAIYANVPQGDPGWVAYYLDEYFLSRTLVRAVRSRLTKLAAILSSRLKAETCPSNWLSLACGSCRELLSIPPKDNLTIWAMDYDPNCIPYARALLQKESQISAFVRLQKKNAMALLSAKYNIDHYGHFTTVYSPGVFDYLDDDSITILASGLYKSLAPNGLLIMPFKDSARYEIYDYLWLAKWDMFFQRTADQVVSLVSRAGIPVQNTTMERDETGAIVFILAHK